MVVFQNEIYKQFTRLFGLFRMWKDGKEILYKDWMAIAIQSTAADN